LKKFVIQRKFAKRLAGTLSRKPCDARLALLKATSGFEESKHNRDGKGRFSAQGGTASGNELAEKLDMFAVPMMEMEYSRENYNKLFKGGFVKTPIGTVRMGSDQFDKLARKDGGARKSYLGAAWQTLTDPVMVIGEGDDRVYIKSFSGDKGFSTFVSVEKNKEDGRFVITNYMRHKSEVLKKIKWADGVIYQKDNVDGGPARMDKGGIPHAESSHTPTVSPDPLKKSSGRKGKRLLVKSSLAKQIMGRLDKKDGNKESAKDMAGVQNPLAK
jgi:hypothetical protein